jgi:predicted nucleic acid-binding protein
VRQSIYLDTSVVSAYFDDRIPYQRDITRQWWETVRGAYDVLISEVVLLELERAKEPKRSSFLALIEGLPQLAGDEEVTQTANGYVQAGIVPDRYLPDAFHIAYASCYRVDYLVTSNCSHLANVKKRRAVALYNTSAGLFVPEIVTPEFFRGEDDEQE